MAGASLDINLTIGNATTLTGRAFHIFHARVYLAQVPLFRSRQVDQFHFTLLEWAANARRRAAACQRIEKAQHQIRMAFEGVA